jgi:hypothetical protein
MAVEATDFLARLRCADWLHRWVFGQKDRQVEDHALVDEKRFAVEEAGA